MKSTWTDEQILFVVQNYYRISTRVISLHIGKSRSAIISKAKRLDVAHNDNTEPKKPYLDEYLHGKGKHQLLYLAEKKAYTT